MVTKDGKEMRDMIKVSAPATIANLGPGYDLMGMALDRPSDILEVEFSQDGEDAITVTGVGSETISNALNNASLVAGRAVLKKTGNEEVKLSMRLNKGVPPRMGMGSSGASSAAGAFAVNELLGRPLEPEALLICAMEGERASCGAAHADNVAPALFGGVVVITDYSPIRVCRLNVIEGAEIVVVSPELEMAQEKTKLAREVLPREVPLSKLIAQMSAFASLIAGITNKDLKLLGSGISRDVIIEPARSVLIPGFKDVKEAALSNGAYGCSISGAGPSIFAIAPEGEGVRIGKAMKDAFGSHGVKAAFSTHECNKEGARVV
uniref:Homoserine kinase n=1 Tax=Candidatus Methanomethylicus mesodigestus TaxID=1867258 RepID=A0A7C3F0I0_9CREN